MQVALQTIVFPTKDAKVISEKRITRKTLDNVGSSSTLGSADGGNVEFVAVIVVDSAFRNMSCCTLALTKLLLVKGQSAVVPEFV